MLTALKQEFPWLKEPDKFALQKALQNLETAYSNYFRGIKENKKYGFPKFKSKKHSRKSYYTANNGNNIRVIGNGVRLPKVGVIKGRIDRDIPTSHRIISATISQEPTEKYYVSILTEFEREPKEISLNYESAIGLDYSSPYFFVDSNGSVANMPHYYRVSEGKLKREQRKLSRMTNGSSNYNKQKVRVARAHEKIRNQRKDWHHKESTILANSYDVICLEDINLQAMGRTLNLAKATQDNGFGQFRTYLQYKMADRGKRVITIDKWYPSSKTCRFCGYINPNLKLGESTWICSCCGAHISRDLNAAINIRNEGLRYAQ